MKIIHSNPGIGFLDNRYVNVTGDTMTGPLVITPTSDSTEVLKVTNAADTNDVLVVDTTNGRVGVNMGGVAPGAGADVIGGNSIDSVRGTHYTGGSGTASVTNQFIARYARGTAASPSALQFNDLIGGFAARAYLSTAFNTGGNGSFSFYCVENQTDNNRGTRIQISLIPSGAGPNQGLLEMTRVSANGDFALNNSNAGLAKFSAINDYDHPIVMLRGVGFHNGFRGIAPYTPGTAGFAGLCDMTVSGTCTATSTILFRVQIDAVNAISTINSTPTAGGSGYTAGDDLTITTGSGTATANVDTVDGSGAVTGLTLLTRGSTYAVASGIATTGGTGTGCTIEITAVVDTFQWRIGSNPFTTGVVMTGSAQLLTFGISVRFTATVGHTLSDRWDWSSGFQTTDPVQIQDSSSTNQFRIDKNYNTLVPNKKLGVGTTQPQYKVDVAGSSNAGDQLINGGTVGTFAQHLAVTNAGRLTVGAIAPSNPQSGSLWLDTS